MDYSIIQLISFSFNNDAVNGGQAGEALTLDGQPWVDLTTWCQSVEEQLGEVMNPLL